METVTMKVRWILVALALALPSSFAADKFAPNVTKAAAASVCCEPICPPLCGDPGSPNLK